MTAQIHLTPSDSLDTCVDGMAALEEFGHFLHRLSFADLDPKTIDATRQRIFDTLGATAIGLATAEGRLLQRLDSSLYRTNGAKSNLDRARLLVGATRTTEIDDIDIKSCTTIGSVVVPLALAIAESALDRDLITAIVAGYEAMGRLGRAMNGATLIYSGVWPTYVATAFASAAVTAKLNGFSEDETIQALALALARSHPIARNALEQPAYRHFALGAAALDGCVAALAAGAGLRGPSDSLKTLASQVNAKIDESRLNGKPGTASMVLEVDTKMFPSSRQAIASVEAFVEQLPLPAPIAAIDTISVGVPAAYRRMVDRPDLPARRIDSMIGVQYQMALAATGSDAFYDPLRHSLPSNEQIEVLVSKISVYADDQLSACFPQSWGSRVTVRFTSGEATTTEVLSPRGGASLPLSWRTLRDKYEKILSACSPGDAGHLDALQQRAQSLGVTSSGRTSAKLLSLAQSVSEALPGSDG